MNGSIPVVNAASDLFLTQAQPLQMSQLLAQCSAMFASLGLDTPRRESVTLLLSARHSWLMVINQANEARERCMQRNVVLTYNFKVSRSAHILLSLIWQKSTSAVMPLSCLQTSEFHRQADSCMAPGSRPIQSAGHDVYAGYTSCQVGHIQLSAYTCCLLQEEKAIPVHL